ncbi:MAG: sigma-70 family RNA polymerase sigma factor [Janthinobacterium lividum]
MNSTSVLLSAEQHETADLARPDRDETRDRTRDLMSNLAYASPAERAAIREEVVTLHLWLAASVARRYGPQSEFDDLVQVARIGLVEAFDRFDPDQSTYSTFAWVTVTGLLRRYLRDLGWSVRPPRSLQVSANRLRRVMPELTQDLGRTPTTADAAEHLGWTSNAVREAELANQGMSATSIDALVGDSWVPEQAPEWDGVETRMLLERAVRALSEDERRLLQLRFLDELSQAQIAVALGINQMGVSRRLTRLMSKLRTEIGDLEETGSPHEVRALPAVRAVPHPTRVRA